MVIGYSRIPLVRLGPTRNPGAIGKVIEIARAWLGLKTRTDTQGSIYYVYSQAAEVGPMSPPTTMGTTTAATTMPMTCGGPVGAA